MHVVKEREAEVLQHRIQSEVNVADDEIERLTAFLNSIQAEIIDAKDQMKQFSDQIEQLNRLSKGEQRENNAKKKTRLAYLRTEHLANLIGLRGKHKEEIQQLNDDFEKFYATVEQWMMKKQHKATHKIDDKISKIKSQLNDLSEKTEIQKRSFSSESEIKQLEESKIRENLQIQELKEKYKQKMEDRLEILLSHKNMLEEAIINLELSDSQYDKKIKEATKRLDDLDNNFQQRINAKTERYDKEIAALNKKLCEAEAIAENAREALNESQKLKNEKLNSSIIEQQTIKSVMKMSPMKSFLEETQPTSIIEKKDPYTVEEIERLTKMLEFDENHLLEERTKNEFLRREVARVKHEIRINKHRALFA